MSKHLLSDHSVDSVDSVDSPGSGSGSGSGSESESESESESDSTSSIRQRVLSVKLDFSKDDKNHTLYNRIRALGWQSARYANQFVAAKWADMHRYVVDPAKDIKNGITKKIRETEKMELSGAAYSAMERQVQSTWQRLAKRIMAGAPLPQWNPNAALLVRGHKNRNESGVYLTSEIDSDTGKEYITAHLSLQNKDCAGGCWFHIPIVQGAQRDYQIELLHKMITWEVPISRAAIVVAPMRHRIMLQLSYAITIPLPRFGNRAATLGPIVEGERLTLRTETETLDFTGKLHSILSRKDQWDGIRRRCRSQFGRTRGQARAKREKLAQWSWEDWLDTQLNQWSREIIDYLDSQGIARLTVLGLQTEDWAVYRFTQLLKNKGEEVGVTVHTEADLAEPGTERAVKRELTKQRLRATQGRTAIRRIEENLSDRQAQKTRQQQQTRRVAATKAK